MTGDINVMGQAGGNSSNAIASNVDLGGGTQVVRISAQGQIAGNSALIFTGNLSNGSLLKTFGTSFNGVMATADGMSLFGNNTYTGSTILNAGNNVIAGTNATSRIEIAGISGAGKRRRKRKARHGHTKLFGSGGQRPRLPQQKVQLRIGLRCAHCAQQCEQACFGSARPRG